MKTLRTGALSTARRMLSRAALRRRVAGATVLAVVASGALAAVTVAAATPASATLADAKNVTAVLFQWPWASVAKECTDNLGPAGYGYVQVSPPTDTPRLQDQWWTSYQPVTYEIGGKEGTRAQFASMVSTCNAAGVKVIVDVIVNHMSGTGSIGAGSVDGHTFSKYSYPGLYSDSDFHSCRHDITNWGDKNEVQTCELVSLSDLDTGNDSVRTKIAGFLNDLLSLGVSGFRIDAAKHVANNELQAIKAKLTNPNVYWAQEVIADGTVPASDYYATGDVHDFNYAHQLKSQFGSGQIKNLSTFGTSWGILPSANASVFVSNHDTERNGDTLSYKDGASYTLANVFMLAYPDGSPSIQSGFSFGSSDDEKAKGAAVDSTGHVLPVTCGQSGWLCVHDDQPIVGLVGFHNAVGSAALNSWWDNGNNQIAFGRGTKGFVVINHENSSLTKTFQTSMPAGSYCDRVTTSVKATSCTGSSVITVTSSGQATVTVPAQSAVAFDVDKPATAVVDSTPPTTPTNLRATANGTTVSLTWTASSDDVGVSGYTVTRTGPGTTRTTLSASSNSFTDTGLAASTAYSYTVSAQDASGKTSGESASAGVTTGEKSSTTVYYSTSKGWSSYYIHYQVGTGAWTTVPGVQMTPACTGWVSKDIDLGAATTLTVTFNNGSGTWDSNGEKNYALSAGVSAVSNGTISTVDPCGSTDPGTDPGTGSGATTVYYPTSQGWSDYYVHYQVGSGAWTTAPGVRMVAACTGWVSANIDTGSETTLTVTFNNGSGTWDNNGGKNYALTSGTSTVDNGVVTKTAPCVDSTAPTAPTGVTATASASSVAVSWTASTDNVGVVGYTVTRSGGGSPVQSSVVGTTFTDANVTAGATYTYSVVAKDAAGNTSVAGTSPSVKVPDAPGSGADTTPPTAPSNLRLASTSSSVTLSWTASTDAVGVAGYVVVRTGGGAPFSSTVTGTAFVDSALTVGQTYYYAVLAVDEAGNVSDQAGPISFVAGVCSTGETDPGDNGGGDDGSDDGGGGDNGGGDNGDDDGGGDTGGGTGSISPTISYGGYATNPSNQLGAAKTITVDGSASDWTPDMIIAQGVANDDPRIFRGSHEGPVYDPYSLSAAWDDGNLYLMWQLTNVTDVVDPAQGYPISDNGKPYQGDIPQALAFDVDPSKGSDGTIDGTGNGTTDGVWGIRDLFGNKEVDHLAMFSSKPGVGQPAMFSLNSAGNFDYKVANVKGFTDAGISFKYGDGFSGSTLLGINKNGYQGYTPADLTDASKLVNFLTLGHSTAQDTIYEMKIPLTALGTTKAKIESQGLGVMLISTFGQSAIGSLPQDATTLDNALLPYSADESTSKEKEDVDTFTVPFARVGHVATTSGATGTASTAGIATTAAGTTTAAVQATVSEDCSESGTGTGLGDTGTGTGTGDTGSGTGDAGTGSGDTGSGEAGTGTGDDGTGDNGSGDNGSGGTDNGSVDDGSGTGTGDSGTGGTGSGDDGSGTGTGGNGSGDAGTGGTGDSGSCVAGGLSSLTTFPGAFGATFVIAAAGCATGGNNTGGTGDNGTGGSATTSVASTTVVPTTLRATFGDTASLPVTVKAGTTAATGTVTVKEGTRTLASSSLRGGKATVTLVGLSAGTHRVTVSYAPSTVSVKASQAASTVAVAKGKASLKSRVTSGAYGTSRSGLKAVRAGKKAVVKVTVSARGLTAPAGTVTLRAKGKVLGKATVTRSHGSWVATVKVSKKASKKVKKTTAIKATYSGTSNIAVKTSSTGLKVKR